MVSSCDDNYKAEPFAWCGSARRLEARAWRFFGNKSDFSNFHYVVPVLIYTYICIYIYTNIIHIDSLLRPINQYVYTYIYIYMYYWGTLSWRFLLKPNGEGIP